MDTNLQQRLRALQWLSIGWMGVEWIAGLIFGIRAHSVVLTAFSADSAIELLSAILVLERFRRGPDSERHTARLAAGLLYALAAYVLITSSLALFTTRWRAEPTLPGIVLLAISALLMPLLGAAKRRFAARTGSCTLRADAAQNQLCAYLSWISLGGLAINALFHRQWADPLAALLLLPLILREARDASRGELCHCA